METNVKFNALDIKDIEEFCCLPHDDKVLYICAVHINRNGNIVHRNMVQKWIENIDNEFQEVFPLLYYKFTQTRDNWPVCKFKDFERDLINGYSKKLNGSLFELKTLEEAVILLKARTSNIAT